MSRLWFSLSVEGFGLITDGFIIETLVRNPLGKFKLPGTVRMFLLDLLDIASV